MNTETETVEEEQEVIECAHCGCKLVVDDDSIYYLEDEGDLCPDCFYDAAETCQLCGRDDLSKKDLSRYIVVKVELGETDDIPPGIYRIQSYPFLSIPMIGGGRIWGSDVLFVDCLPMPDDHYDISGHICKKCALPYSQTYGRVYGQIKEGRGHRHHRQRGHWPLHSAQRIRVNEVFRNHPERLRDLEEEHEFLEDMFEKFGLKPVQTWHEWPFLQHNGVKVFRMYQGDSGWLTLRPSPRFRNHSYWDKEVSALQFAASSLPTFDMDAAEKRNTYYDKSGRLEREAVIKAIDLGILTQDGLLLPKG